MLNISFCDQDVHLSFAGLRSSFLTKRSSDNSSSLPCFVVHFLLLRLLLLFTGCPLNLWEHSICIISPASQFVWLAHFLDSKLSKLPLWNIQGQCYGSLWWESQLQSDCSHGEVYSRGLMGATWHHCQGSAYSGRGCPLLLPELHGVPVWETELLSRAICLKDCLLWRATYPRDGLFKQGTPLSKRTITRPLRHPGEETGQSQRRMWSLPLSWEL